MKEEKKGKKEDVGDGMVKRRKNESWKKKEGKACKMIVERKNFIEEEKKRKEKGGRKTEGKNR